MTSQRTSAEDKKSAKAQSRGKNYRKSKSGRWLWFAVGMGGIALVSGMAGALLAVSWESTPLQQAQLSAKEAAVFDGDRISGDGFQFSQLTRPVNILVMGMSVLPPDIQNPPSETKELRYLPQVNSFDGLADVMLLLKFDPESKKIVMLSVPRDTRTEVEGYGVKKINAANVDGGPALTAKTVSNLLGGVGIDRYVRINVLGVGKLIDALGGVTVYVPKDMKYQDDSQHLYINLKAGKQHLDGNQALQLLRFRHDELGDIGRIQRQQMVLRALIEQTLNPTTLTQLPQILNVVKDNIDTNLTIEELVALVGFGSRTNRSNMQMLMLPGRFSERSEYEASYWLPNKTAITKVMVQNFGLESTSLESQITDPARLRIAIQDSTGGDYSQISPLIKGLEKAGYPNVFISKPWGEPLEITHIVAQQGDSDSAESIRNTLGFGEVRVESTGNIGSDISIQVGKDWLQNKAIFENLSR
ncbi:LCP family protein [Anabaena cylindrica FACHB-243]|uniref:Cell envelope-related transcriptional attenuator n=1 Tax=Anabaena cylindrica (strain ATCC 27899 / PCC 7122) TaxID=272123 RepID=K9ZDA3_ANACC|nr:MULTISPECIES: LCP family protein [Anabaena]AFZ57166.1 cell envelope-related transcriptional attenuator [Anabaena cylindrica PCC 7122]MBD2418050.1 LCP family protein [Anabaena cylindrica FACHB-243]MBY5283504.1 LCP family protein [Anabaena sp. CCAP 1446/1C]MBY5309658.1 LCP family protein [Anabaena sp. CCAP 1446/1C]MCM2408743.1 LCP family protein [Anabaena sp. CCAP 1446/1C]